MADRAGPGAVEADEPGAAVEVEVEVEVDPPADVDEGADWLEWGDPPQPDRSDPIIAPTVAIVTTAVAILFPGRMVGDETSSAGHSTTVQE